MENSQQAKLQMRGADPATKARLRRAPYWAALLGKAAAYFEAKNILELGTSFGLTTAYLAQTGARVITLEGCPETADVARQTFAHTQSQTITLLEGTIASTLPSALNLGPFDMVIIDANHSADGMQAAYRAALPHLATPGLVVFDDIYWSRETATFWKRFVAEHPNCQIIDLFRQGWVFHIPSQQGEYFRLRTPVWW